MKIKVVIGASLIVALTGCTDKLERKLANAEAMIGKLERDIAQLEAGVLANDRSLKADVYNLKTSMDRRIGEIKSKTDLFCVALPSDPEDRGIRIYKEGRCN